MKGIPVMNHCFIYGDNQSVLWIASIADSMLKKKTASVYKYHFVHKAASSDQWMSSYKNTKDNPSDILTKNLPAGTNSYNKIRMILYDTHPVLNDGNDKTTIRKCDHMIVSRGVF